MSADIPVIDLSQVDVDLLRDACATWGLFQVVGHDVPQAAVDALRTQSRQFFALPMAEKQAVARTADNPWGYFDRELTKNVRDWKEIFDVGPAYGAAVPQWPAAEPAFRAALQTYAEAIHTLSLRVLEVLLASLGESPASLVATFRQHTSFLRLNYYPPCPEPAAANSATVPAHGRLGIGHHTDAGALTVLDQADVPGLQALRDGRWWLVPVREGAFTINLGDVVQVWSNDTYTAPVHRVLAQRDATRFSTAYFLNPPEDCIYAPLPGAMREHPACYRGISWREFRARRAAGDYADYGQEVQISDYRIA
ncbi:MAG: 2-oxoglutarate and iron-dependent oxygenase domain-containing protein [Pseudomonadales bacterium]